MIAHVFGGGGAGAAQQLAIYRNFLDEGNPLPELLVGTSAGGLMSMLISHCGVDGAEQELLSIRKREDVFSDHPFFGWGKLGFWNSKPLQKRLERIMKFKSTIPYYTTAYDLKDHHTQYFKESDGWFYNAATACIPILVEPISCYIDGGITEGTPLRLPIDKGASEIHLFQCFAPEPIVAVMPKNKIEVLIRCYNAMVIEIGRNDMKVAEFKSQNGRRPVTIEMHLPEKNLLHDLEFEKMEHAYKTMRKK